MQASAAWLEWLSRLSVNLLPCTYHAESRLSSSPCSRLSCDCQHSWTTPGRVVCRCKGYSLREAAMWAQAALVLLQRHAGAGLRDVCRPALFSQPFSNS